VAVTLIPSISIGFQVPFTTKGPVITGVTTSEAWVTWYTSHHQGTPSGANECARDSDKKTIPTLTLSTVSQGSPSNVKTYTSPECSRFHKVHLVNLSPGTSYKLTLDRPYGDDKATPQGQFTTPPASTSVLVKFIVYGDNRDEPVTSPSTRPNHQALVDAIVQNEPDSAFLVNVGDLALNYPSTIAGDDRGYTEFFNVERKLLATRPIFTAFGNHESLDTEFYDKMMSAPTLGNAQHPYYFSIDWGSVHIAFLNPTEGILNLAEGGNTPLVTDDQVTWLEKDLAAAKSSGRKIFIVSHQGAYSYCTEKCHGGLSYIQSKVVPLIVKYGVLNIFAGHDHYYERGRQSCINFVVVGAGGAPMYDPNPSAPGVVAAKKTTSYLVVTVDGSTVSAVAKDTDGKEIDRFEMLPPGCGPLDENKF
jgi:hypothetical protein